MEDKHDPLAGKFRWEIPKFSTTAEKKLYSQNFMIGGYWWKLLCFPKGNSCECLSVYMDVADNERLPSGWSRYAWFQLTVINSQFPERHSAKEAQHHFNAKESDWGFTQFLPLSDLMEPDSGFLSADDTLVIEAQVSVRKKPEPNLFDSRKELGHVGLKNQGATCYMNSLLQTLYNLPYFRKAVYQIPTGDVDPSSHKNIPLALQSLFYKLQTSPTAVATKDLTKSFGWDTMDAFTQHDVQELNRVLCEKLEEKMKGTRVDKTIDHLFQGYVVNYIECINVDYKSTRKEPYLDLSLIVKGCKDVYESFDKFVEVETLDEDNQYQAEGHGKQDARKGILFKSFPPVLQLQLKRFEYDFMRDMMVKINERYEFPEVLDLDIEDHKYLTADADKSKRNKYILHSVLVHSGGVHGGHYKSTRKEPYLDLSLIVKGCKDVYESFDKFVEVETLDEDNQYQAEGHGKQDARKGILFKSFPPVLQLQLKRFEYDFMRDMMVKINERYEFPEVLDLDIEDHKYLTADADKSKRNKYILHSVLVHSGGVHGGHYYAFINPENKQWLKFDDDKVTAVDAAVAVGEQFGGDMQQNTQPGLTGTMFKYNKFSSAYMLVYVREEDWPHIVCPVGKEDVEEHLRTRLDMEQVQKERRRKEKQEAHLYVTVRLATDKALAAQVGHHSHFDLIDFELTDGPASVLQIRKPKSLAFRDFKAQIQEELGVPVKGQRYWQWSQRQNRTYRPSKIIDEDLQMHTIGDVRDTLSPSNRGHLNLFLETATPTPEYPLEELTEEKLLLFFKFYDPADESLKYVGRLLAPKNCKVGDLIPEITKFVDLPFNAPVELYEEVKNEPEIMCPRLDLDKTLASTELECGDIICFQNETPDDAHTHPHVDGFLVYIKNKQLVKFKQLDGDKDAEPITIQLSRVDSYDAVVAALAEQLKVADSSKLRLTGHNSFTNSPKPAAIKYQGASKLEEMLNHYQNISDILYYEVLEMPLYELERLKTLKVHYHNSSAAHVSEHELQVPKDSTVKAVLDVLKEEIGCKGDAEFRLFELFYSRIYKVYGPEDTIESINDQYWTLRAEEVPEDQVEVGPTDRLIQVQHCLPKKDTAPTNVQCFGDPFLMVVKEEEPLSSVTKRIKEKLEVDDEEFAKWTFAIVSSANAFEALEDEDLVVASKFEPDSSFSHSLGLVHEDKNPRKHHNPSRYGRGTETAIKIHG